jgi:hypothetical protein
MFRNLLIFFFLTFSTQAFALPSTVTLHQSMLFPKLESSLSRWCRLYSSSRTSACFTKSLVTQSSKIISAQTLEKLLNREFTGTLHLNRAGLNRTSFKEALGGLFKKHAPDPSSALAQTQAELLESSQESATPWIDGLLWSPLENGTVLVLQKPDAQHGINEIFVLFAGSQTENF